MPGKKDASHDTKNGQKNDPKKNKPRGRSISREQHERRRERHAQKMATKEAQDIYALRRHPGERPFAMIKHHFGLRRFLLRGLDAVRDEWRWAALAFNLQRIMSLLRSRAGPEPDRTAPTTLAVG